MGTDLQSVGAPAAAAAPTAASVGNPTTMIPLSVTPSTCGTKRSLPDPQLAQQGGGRSAAAATVTTAAVCTPTIPAPDRHVFLRQRRGGESVSSGNSSTTSDNGSASDDVGGSGEWEMGAHGAGSGGGTARLGTKFVQNGAAIGIVKGGVAAVGVLSGAATAEMTEAVGGSQSSRKAARRQWQAGTKSRQCRKDGEREHRASTRTSGDGIGGAKGGYASWAALVKPFKQQWDHVDAPALQGGAGTSLKNAAPLSETHGSSNTSSCCSVFSPEPRPSDQTAFSVEQRSAHAHTTAVASYVLRVRCGGGAHIVRRTWDDVILLCTMLRRDLALLGVHSVSVDGNGGRDAARGARASVAVASAGSASATATAGVEFAPADVVAPDAASGFLKDLLARQGMASAMPVRRFLELEFLDGTLRGGATDGGRETAAREVAAMAASAAASAAAATAAASTSTLGVPLSASVGVGDAEGAQANAATASATGFRLNASRFNVVVPPLTPSLPAHPDAARDLAAVCRCLGELGAAAFTSMPQGGAPYWATNNGVGREAGAVGTAPHRGMAVGA